MQPDPTPLRVGQYAYLRCRVVEILPERRHDPIRVPPVRAEVVLRDGSPHDPRLLIYADHHHFIPGALAAAEVRGDAPQ